MVDVLLENLQSSIRGFSRLIKILTRRISEYENITSRLDAIECILHEQNLKLNRFFASSDREKSPSCISLHCDSP